MLVTLLPIVTLVSPLQYAKALGPMLVTLSPIVTLVSPVQSWKACSPILVTGFELCFEGITSSVSVQVPMLVTV